MRNRQDTLSGGPKVIKAGFTNWLVQVQTIGAENVWGLLEEFLVHHKPKAFLFVQSQITDIQVIPKGILELFQQNY